ncbi:uncharacterized protein LOC124315376 [Daphnia pulicaria]|uniref:uncharacterized protein LOC124315376 n=1 Tax=Daphnia pulicaria TaxID=35523 RepID=UPI001EEBCF41|nr:uncharacterized protein LOC124315376 [Daphnia pulicaria]
MIQPAKFNARNLFLGFVLFALAFFIFFWQFVGLSPPQNAVSSAVNSINTETVQPSTVIDAVTEVMQQTTTEKSTSQRNCNRTFNAVDKNSTTWSVLTTPGSFRWCSLDSSARGAHQKVISYSLFGTGQKENVSVSDRFVKLLRNISVTAEKSYPGWIVRIYHNFRNQSEHPDEKSVFNQLSELSCQFSHVDLCSLTEMIASLTSSPTPIDPDLLRGLNGRMFRYLVMLDPNVDIFISRDIDSVIWQREVDAVDQWLKSNFTFHLMRDHKFHSATILAGMWGVKLDQRRDLVQGLTRAMILAGQNQQKSTDQDLLDKIFWPSAQYDVMAHDSYHCRNGKLNNKSPIKVLPFPTRRNCSCYVGGIGGTLKPEKCPEACRPPDHKDWEYC